MIEISDLHEIFGDCETYMIFNSTTNMQGVPTGCNGLKIHNFSTGNKWNFQARHVANERERSKIWTFSFQKTLYLPLSFATYLA